MNELKLEIGCGGGIYRFNPRICPNCEESVFGDIERLKNFPVPNFVVLDAQYMPFKTNSFSEIYLAHVIEHLNYPIEAVKEAYRVLSKSGKAYIWTPNFIDSSSKFDKTHKQVYNVFKLRKILQSCGFQVHTYTTSIGNRLGLLKQLIQYTLLIIGAELFVTGEKQ